MKERTYSYVIRATSTEEKDALESHLGNVKFHNPLEGFGIELWGSWSCRIRMSEADLLVFKLKFPNATISRTYLSKEKRFMEDLKQLERFGLELGRPKT